MITQLNGDNQKVHYPLPLNLLETEQATTLDRETLKLMISRMAKKLQSSASSQASNGFNTS
jgi:hypothetical protein